MPAARPQVVDPARIRRALDDVRDEPSFIHELLAATLDWPIVDGNATRVDEIGYQHRPRGGAKTDAIDRKVLDIVELNLAGPQQLWGIFLLRFKDPSVFDADRGMTGVLRELLRDLVPRRRAPDGRKTWDRPHLLFLCTHDFTQFRFAHFKAPKEAGVQPKLAAFGWLAGSEAVRTVCEFNLSHLAWPKAGTPDVDWADAWAQAFDVASVTKGFYEDYREEEEDLRIAVAPLLGETDPKAEPVKTFTQSLLNRLMFLRFIERKGWLTPPGKAEASRDYLSDLYALGGVGKKSFFASRLRPLFFEGLAIDGKQSSSAIGTVPFLNGGLFEESELDKTLRDADLDAALAPWLDAKAGLFYRYNFTVQESTPLDVEVAVDPEMLGKVFEELVTGRHESGSYYTPRNVVSFMCREALKGYLVDAAKLTADQAAAFVDKHEVTSLSVADAGRIAQALGTLRAVDPACGSGAYLLGLLHEVVDLYRALYSDKLRNDARAIHAIKLDVIQNSLYGVDVDEFATNIARLRMWLSLTVDSDAPHPLPNLDFKIETGDSVTGPDPQQGADVTIAERAHQLAIVKGKYLRATGPDKASLKRLIEKEQKEIGFTLRSLYPGAIDWRVQFCEVFFNDTRGGFDIVLANPPYIRQELIKHLKPALKKVYGPLFSGTADLYVFFYLRALQLLAPGGMLAFISSNKWFRAGYGKQLRAHIAKTTTVGTILDFHDLPVFESAIAYPMIFVASKRTPPADHTATLAEPPTLEPPYPNVAKVVETFGHRMPTAALGREGNWHLAKASAADALTKMRAAGPTLLTVVDGAIHAGIKTGFNVAFWIDDETRRRLINEDAKSAELIKPMIVGRDLRRWGSTNVKKWVIFTRRGAVKIRDYPAIKSHLSAWKAELTPKSDSDDEIGRKPGPYEWFELQDNLAYFEKFSKPKILFPDISPEPRFTFDTHKMHPDMTAFMLGSSDLYLLAVLNSHAVLKFYSDISAQVQGGFMRYKRQYLEQIPIPDASAADRKAIAALAQKCLDAKGVGCEAWEREIDERVAALYGL